jgi:hypothetical protein
LAYNAQTTDFLNIIVSIGNKPMARNQLNTGGTGIFDSDRIGKGKLTVIGVRLLWQKLGFDRNTDFVKIHARILLYP